MEQSRRLTAPLQRPLRQQYLELARRESEWSARYGKDHLAVVNLRNRMQEIRNSLFDELRHAAATAKNDYEIAKLREEEIEKQLANTVAQVGDRLSSGSSNASRT